MKQISAKFAVGLIAVLALLGVFAGCSDKPTGPNAGPNVSFDISYETAIPKLQQQINSVRLTITGIGIDTPIVVSTDVQGDGTFELVVDSVPSGPARIFSLELLYIPAFKVGAQAQPVDVVLYRGVTAANVAPDAAVSVPISLVPTVPMLKLTPMASEVMSGSSFSMNLVAYNLPTAVWANIVVDFGYYQYFDFYLDPQPAPKPSDIPPGVFYEADLTSQSEGTEYGVSIGDGETPIPFTGLGPTVLATIPFNTIAFTDTIRTVNLYLALDNFSCLDSTVLNMFSNIPYLDVPFLEQSQVTLLPLPDREVTFPDPEMDAAIRGIVYPNGGSNPIMLSQVLPITSLNLQEQSISDLRGIGQLANLQYLYLGYYPGLSNLGPVADLKKLTYLTGASCGIRDLSPIAGLTGLWYVDFGDDSLTSIAALANLRNLSEVYLSQNRISDLRPLARLTKVYTLNLTDNNITDISPIAGMTNLGAVHLNGNSISNISALATQPYLYFVNLANNNITDITALIANPGLGTGDQVILTGNPGIPRTQIDALAQKGVTVTGP